MKKTSNYLRAGVAVAALCVAGCAIPTTKEVAYTEDYRYRYPIAVAPEMRTMRIPYDGPGSELDLETQAQLRQFVNDYRIGGAGAISVSSGEGQEHVAFDFSNHIAALGVPRDRILMGTNAQLQSGSEVEIGFISYKAETKPCGDWSENLGTTRNNSPFPNLGCATQSNIAAMVADPRDLMGPQPMDPGDTQRRMTVLERYRAGEVTSADRSELQQNSIAEAGAGAGN
jgi:pilus assembly protein CpaD